METTRRSFALFALTLALSISTASAETSPDTTHTRGVADTVTVLKPVLVQGARNASPERTSSTSVRLDRSRVARFSPSTVSDALVAIPGLNISRSGPWATQVSMRGLSGERVAVLVDGVRLETGRGHGAQTSLVSVDRVETIEAEPGAGSAVNGSDAMAGTLEFTTHRPLFSSERRASLTLNGRRAAPGNEQAEFARLRWMSRRFGFEVSGDASSLQNLVAAPDSTIAHSGFRDQDVTGRVAGLLGSTTIDYEHSTHRAYDIQLPALQTSNGTTARFPLQTRDADRLEVSAPGAGWMPTLRALGVMQRFYTGYDETIVEPHFTPLRQHVSDSHTTYHSRIPMTSRSIQPSADFGAARVFGEYRYESTTGPVEVDSLVYRYPTGVNTLNATKAGEAVPPANRNVWAVGSTGSIARYGVKLDGGLRYDLLHTRNEVTPYSLDPARDLTDHRLSGEAGLSTSVWGWTPYAHVANNFRAPNLDERFAHMMVHGGLYVRGNADLRPEHSTTGEIGVRTAECLGGHVAGVRLSAYRTAVTDLITIKYSEMVFGIPRFQYRNVHNARLEGLEAQADLRAAGVQLAIGAAFPRGRDADTGEPISDIGAASTLFDLRLPVPHIVPQGTFSLRARWSDAHTTSAGEAILARPAFWTASAEAGLSTLGLRWTLAVTNLTNTAYTEPLSFIPSAGRTTTLSVRRDLSLPWLAFAKDH
jgi:iron complex outermembrane receptor protein